MDIARRTTVAVAAIALAVAASACSARREPVRESRPALGTVVTIEAYGSDERALRGAIADAFDEIAAVERALDAYSTTSSVAAINADPYAEHALPPEAAVVLDEVERLGVSAEFSPALRAVVRLYGFDGTPTVPAPGDLALALAASRTFSRPTTATGVFQRLGVHEPRLAPGGLLAPGLDLGGAAKGLALDRAREALRARGVTAAIVSAGSTTVTLGTKPGGRPWRIGIEHPRDTGRVMAVAEWTGEAALSTSGDYQQSFVRDGIRYHHIIDPATGEPARGVQSLTVAGRISGLASDILSTALFVRGADRALAYARERSVSVWLVDGEGHIRTANAAADAGVRIAPADER
ncbi:MAG: FAD:protein FMN transferase [Coriobacteriia bacterium]|nr:FAD:protein FMN transferase [Coriobacteriia bacterium]